MKFTKRSSSGRYYFVSTKLLSAFSKQRQATPRVLLEISAVDPKLGAVFYTLEQRETGRPRLVRNDQCLECHTSSKSMAVPGYMVRSYATDENGVVAISGGISQVTHRTPLAERWGGWYVCGSHGDQLHRGNLIGPAAFARQKQEPRGRGWSRI